VTWIAYVDESMRTPRDDTPGLYVLAAAVLHADDVDTTRDEVRWLSEKRHRRFHWRDTLPSARSKAVDLVKDLPAVHMIVIGAPLDGRRQERGRRICLARLLHELESAGVSEVILETRTRSLNAKDLAAVNAWRAQHVLGHALTVEHGYPSEEPLLWLPDIVAGAVHADAAGEPSWRDVLAPLLTEIHITIR
jgi:hypothetical protein